MSQDCLIDLTNFLQVSFDLHIQSWGKIALKNSQNQIGHSIAAAIGDNLIEVIIPLIAMLVYFVVTLRKKKAVAPIYREKGVEKKSTPVPPPAPLTKHVPLVEAVETPPPSKNKSRAAQLLSNKASIRDALLLQQILKHPLSKD